MPAASLIRWVTTVSATTVSAEKMPRLAHVGVSGNPACSLVKRRGHRDRERGRRGVLWNRKLLPGVHRRSAPPVWASLFPRRRMSPGTHGRPFAKPRTAALKGAPSRWFKRGWSRLPRMCWSDGTRIVLSRGELAFARKRHPRLRQSCRRGGPWAEPLWIAFW